MTRRIVVVGAGFSGTLVAAHLLKHAAGALDVVLVNRSGPMARGLAYGTQAATHVLNVPAGRMGAFPDDEGGFLRYVQQARPEVQSGDFVARSLYGEYLADLLDDAERTAAPGSSLTRLVAETHDVQPAGDGQVDLLLTSGERLRADRVVLALGNYQPADPVPDLRRLAGNERYVRDPWAPGALDAVRGDAPALLIGTGLTMADVALTLAQQAPDGPRIYVLSRRGLWPQAHRWPSHPSSVDLPPDLVTGPLTARAYLGSVRRHVRVRAAEGGDWRDVVGTLRPITPGLWQALPAAERRRFLRHVRPYWETHRHRMAPTIASRLEALLASGRIVRVAGRVLSVSEGADGFTVEVRLRDGDRQRLRIGGIVNCTGPDSDLARVPEPLIAALLTRGAIRADPHRLGVDTTDDYRLVGVDGRPSSTMFYVGPLLRATYWEATAVPELREHAARAVDAVVGSLSAVPACATDPAVTV